MKGLGFHYVQMGNRVNLSPLAGPWLVTGLRSGTPFAALRGLGSASQTLRPWLQSRPASHSHQVGRGHFKAPG